MRLLSLTIDGFKSFARKTTIKFEEGMTGIVGPNGSGKSNIIEAIRWVMGEQSARQLRGDKMADVIFNGSANRAPLNRALVSITFDNSDHYLASDYTELTVSRKLYRNGDSEYLINGQKVRLKDIVDLFIDSGLGRESFSIISQGRIAAIFNGKPEDRRGIIEAVAGVAKYQKNKSTAEKRLATTMDNLNRVSDIIHELSSQLDPLADQSALAKDYLEQKKQFDRFDQTRIVRTYDQQHGQLTKLQAKLQEAQQLSKKYQLETTVAEKKLAQHKEGRTALAAKKDQVQQSILKQTQLIADYRNRRSVSDVKQQQRQREAERLQEQLATNQQAVTGANQDLTKLKATIEEQQTAIASHREELSRAQHLTAGEQLRQLQQRLAELQNQQIDLLQKQTTLHNQATFLQQNHQQSLSQQKQSNADLSARLDRKKSVSAQLTTQQERVDQLQAALTGQRQELAHVNQQLSTVTDRYQQTQRQWYQVLGDAHSTASRIKAFQAMEETYAGYYRGVQSVLKNRDQFPGLAGAVSELVEVPSKLTTAIETVLGGQLQQLVVDQQATGKAIINYLVKTRGGRVTILPLDTLRQRRPLTIWTELASLPGYVGRATELIQYPAKYQLIVDHLLANTVIADNLDHAATIARAGRHQVRVVTLDGQLINASGAMTGGANRHQQHGVLSQKQTGKELSTLLQQQQASAKSLEAQVAQLHQSQEQGQDRQAKLQVKGHDLTQQLQAAQNDVQRLRDQLKELDRQISSLQYQNNQQTDQHQSYQAQVAQNQAAQQQTDRQLAQVKEATQSVNQQIEQLRTNADSQNEQVHQLHQWLAVADERGQQYHQQEQRLVARLRELEKQGQQLTHQRDQLLQSLQVQDSDEKSTAAALDQAKHRLAGLQEQLTAANNDLTAVEEKLSGEEKRQDRLQGLLRAAADNVSDLTAQRIRCEGQLDQLLNQLSEHYSMTIDAARQKADQDISDQDLATRLKLLQRGIDELGTVNVSAIAEYDRVKERYDFLKGQQDDLLTSRDQLQQTMAEMDSTVKKRFLTTFNQVSAAFNETFRQIFNGGRAKLELTDPQHLLTTGVDIIAQPPGKKNQHLNLLSGGERALTAITLLFAVLKVRPVPFAILDEPEAALDDVNVQRFANYLQRFGKSGPQFIVITHRKGTMMGANVLYGVTMQESGVSKMVSVDVVDTLDKSNNEEE
ncbi:chromosome segregation protein SMC [Limosilactobacillus sp.]|uniref:chromosome segregation protein SMC n=1 Tax=Limosilactobacillus sp. TaxID=2773925 RepID=UPI003EFDD2D6